MQAIIKTFSNELNLSDPDDFYPCRLVCVAGGARFDDPRSSYYGFVLEGECTITQDSKKFTLSPHMYFSMPGPFDVETSGKLIVVQRWGYRCLPAWGGPIEQSGRLSYIDNCHSTVLIGPARLGDPVLNLLVFPPETKQTPHVHPTTRLGVVIKGQGYCLQGESKLSLEPGMVFCLPPFAQHCFHSGAEGLSVIAFHPDSDVGPTDELHPMKSRTYLADR